AHFVTNPSGLRYLDLQTGSGAIARPGQRAEVHYTGWLTSGEKFDSSVDRREPSSSRPAPAESSRRTRNLFSRWSSSGCADQNFHQGGLRGKAEESSCFLKRASALPLCPLW